MTSLALDSLTKRYGNQTVVDRLSLSLETGEFLCLLGPSGCGKTTTLQMIAGLTDPSSGRILLDGNDIAGVKPHQRGLGVVFQSYALFPHMTVARNIAFGLEQRKIPATEIPDRVREALALVQLEQYANRFPRQLSGGQQQRIALARALVIRPSILLLDEPLSNLDARLREEMQFELRAIHRSVKVTTIMVTHDQAEAMALSDRIAIMNGGRLEQTGDPGTLYDRPDTAFVAQFLGKTNILRAPVLTSNGTSVRARLHESEVEFSGISPTEGEILLSLRPENLTFENGASGIPGRVSTRIFQGECWLFEINSPLGPIFVRASNTLAGVPREGDTVSLGYQIGDLRPIRESRA